MINTNIKVKYTVLILTTLLVFIKCYGQSKIKVILPTDKSEADHVWQTLLDIDFFDKNNYQVSLPNGKLIDSLKQKSRDKRLSDSDYEDLVVYIKDSVYNKKDYSKGYQAVMSKRNLIEKLINELDKSQYDWDFKTFKTYIVNLTLYGPGGSFNPDDGSILLFTTKDGDFKQYSNPANTIIHEIIHIGIEESIISKYQVPHTLKERIVDTFVMLSFKRDLPEYKIQDMGEYRSDAHLKHKKDLKNLNKIVKIIVN